MSETSGLSLRPAGSPQAPLSARSRLRLPHALASLGQSVAWAALAGHIGLVFDVGAQAVRGAPLRDTHVARARGHCALVVRPPRRPRPRQLQAAEVHHRAAHAARLLPGPRRRAAARAERDGRLLDRVERHGLSAQRVAANHCCSLSGRGLRDGAGWCCVIQAFIHYLLLLMGV